MMRRLFLAAALLFALPLPLQAEGEPATSLPVRLETEEDTRVREVAKDLRCAVCQNESVADSNSQLARNMRDLIRDQVRDGKSADEIRAYFVSRYGDYILMEPRKQGWNWVLWMLPFVLLVAGLVALVLRMRRGASPAAARQAPEDDVIDVPFEETDRLIEALRSPAASSQEKS